MNVEGWREAARKVGRCLHRAEEGAEAFISKWHKIKEDATGER